jgi:hypothetical protein
MDCIQKKSESPGANRPPVEGVAKRDALPLPDLAGHALATRAIVSCRLVFDVFVEMTDQSFSGERLQFCALRKEPIGPSQKAPNLP